MNRAREYRKQIMRLPSFISVDTLPESGQVALIGAAHRTGEIEQIYSRRNAAGESNAKVRSFKSAQAFLAWAENSPQKRRDLEIIITEPAWIALYADLAGKFRETVHVLPVDFDHLGESYKPCFVSKRHRIIMIPNYKVMYSSFSEFFAKQFDLPLKKGRKNLAKLKRIDIGAPKYKDYFKFSFVRNPYDRLASCYFDKFIPHKEANCTLFINPLKVILGREGEIRFEDFVEFVCHINDNVSDRHWRSQYSRTHIGCRNICDFTGRFESLERDLPALYEKLGLDADEGLLSKRKITPNKKKYKTLYSSRLRDMIETRYGADLEAFGYSFEGPGERHVVRTPAKEPSAEGYDPASSNARTGPVIKVVVDGYPDVEIGDSPDWEMDPFDSLVWRRVFLSLRWLAPHLWSENPAESAKAVAILMTYLCYFRKSKRKWYSSNDRITGFRLLLFVDIWMNFDRFAEIADGPDIDRDNLFAVMKKHAERLHNEKVYIPNHNHGFTADRALLYAYSQIPELDPDGNLHSLVRDRMLKQIHALFDEGGFTKEHSIGYQALNADTCLKIEREIRQHKIKGLDVRDFFKRIFATTFMAMDLTHIAGNEQHPMGDSYRTMNLQTKTRMEKAASGDPIANFYNAFSGKPDKRGQILIGRSGWVLAKFFKITGSVPEITFASAANYFSDSHKQNDDLSFTLTAAGRMLIDECSYSLVTFFDDQRHEKSHNTIYSESVDWSRAGSACSGFSHYVCEDGLFALRGFHTLIPGVRAVRTFIFPAPGILVLYDFYDLEDSERAPQSVSARIGTHKSLTWQAGKVENIYEIINTDPDGEHTPLARVRTHVGGIAPDIIKRPQVYDHKPYDCNVLRYQIPKEAGKAVIVMDFTADPSVLPPTCRIEERTEEIVLWMAGDNGDKRHVFKLKPLEDNSLLNLAPNGKLQQQSF